MCIQCNAFDAIWTNYIVNEHQVSPAHHLYTKWKFIVPFTLLPFEMLAQMSTRTHTHNSSSSSSSTTILSFTAQHTTHTLNYQQIKWHAITYFCDSAIHLMHFKWTHLCVRIHASVCMYWVPSKRKSSKWFRFILFALLFKWFICLLY